jgi:hypothetical protein
VTTEKIGPGIADASGGRYMVNADCPEWMRNVDPRAIDHGPVVLVAMGVVG